MLTKRKAPQHDASGEAVAIDVLGWMVADEDRLFPFLNATGSSPDAMRTSLADPAFLAGVLDHVMGDEAVLLACAEGLGIAPERIAAAWRHLSPPGSDEF